MQEIIMKNSYDVHIRYGRKVIAHASCNLVDGEIQIRDLYVTKSFRGKGLGEVLLAKVLDYADEQNATRIVSFCGPEPFCEDGQIPVDQEIAWYEDHGFAHDHDVLGITPCMVRDLQREAVI